MNEVQKIVGTGLLYLLSIGLGVWLSYSGRPLNKALSAVHKLVSLGAAVVTVFLFLDLLKGFQLYAAQLALLIAAGACIAALIGTGAILSGAKDLNKKLRLMHSVLTVAAVVCLAGAVYLGVM
jgi:hypothetical protein